MTVAWQDSASLRSTASDEIPVLRSGAESRINLFLMKRLLLFLILSAAFPYAPFANDARGDFAPGQNQNQPGQNNGWKEARARKLHHERGE